jgi:hypothetical protein
MPFKLAVSGPRALASFLVDTAITDLLAEEIETDIRENPRMYYPEYLMCCKHFEVPPSSEGVWVDLCRG